MVVVRTEVQYSRVRGRRLRRLFLRRCLEKFSLTQQSVFIALSVLAILLMALYGNYVDEIYHQEDWLTHAKRLSAEM